MQNRPLLQNTPVLGTEVDPAAIVSSLRSSQQLTAPLDLQNAMPNPQNPQAIQAAKEGLEVVLNGMN